VREGKGSVSGHVEIPDSLKKHLKQFLRWKEIRGEFSGNDDYLFVGQRGPWSSQAIQQVVKKYLKALGLYESGKSAHALRHSYAVQLYAKEKDLRAVQKQLRHVSIQSTLIYADVSKDEIRNQIKGLWS
jgi:integrase/recombinase XerD